MITEFGKIMRKYRVDHDMIMKDMSMKIGVSLSKLSGTENGRYRLTKDYVYSVLDAYQFTEDEVKRIIACLPKEEKAVEDKVSVEKGSIYTCKSWNIRVEEGEKVIITDVSEEDDLVEFQVLSNGQCWGMGLCMFEGYFVKP